MSKYTTEQLMEQYKKIPKDVQEAILSVNTSKAVQEIGKKYNLAIDKVGELADETGLVMVGLIHPKDFVSNLNRRLGADKETARAIAEEINDRIFALIRESLKNVHKIGEPEAEAEEIKKPFESPTGIQAGKEEILKEIEKGDAKVPEIIKGTKAPAPFEAKTEKEMFRMPPEETEYEEKKSEEAEKKVEAKYPEKDPYRESVD